jgi:hypothetical protein
LTTLYWLTNASPSDVLAFITLLHTIIPGAAAGLGRASRDYAGLTRT